MEPAIQSLVNGATSISIELIADGSNGGVTLCVDVPTYRMGALGLHAVTQHITRSKSLQSLTFSFAPSTSDEDASIKTNTNRIKAIHEVLGAVAYNMGESLSCVTLLNVVLDESCLDAMAEMGSRKKTQLRELHLLRAGLKSDWTAKLQIALSEMKGLHSLSIESSPIGDEGVAAVVQNSLKHMPCLEMLCLQQVGATSVSIQNVLKTFLLSSGEQHRLSILELGRNDIDDAAMEVFSTPSSPTSPSSSFSGTSYLKTLSLEFNKIGDDGAIYLSEFIRVNTTLEALSLKHNEVSCEGALALLEAVEANPNSVLEHINLDLNFIGDVGMEGLALIVNNMEAAPNFVFLDVQGNRTHDHHYHNVLRGVEKRVIRRFGEAYGTPRYMLGSDVKQSKRRLKSIAVLGDIPDLAE